MAAKGWLLEGSIGDAQISRVSANKLTAGTIDTAIITVAFEKTTTEELVAAKGWLLEGSIGDAQISRVSANKLTAGTIDTAIITVAGSDGHLRISDNTIQIKDLQRPRFPGCLPISLPPELLIPPLLPWRAQTGI